MNPLTHTSIAYIACRLITGKRIAFLYNLTTCRSIEIAKTSDIDFIGEFDERHSDYIPGYASECRYEIKSSKNGSVEIFVNEKTFIAHVKGSDAYYIGNIQRDIIYIYDQKDNAHHKYRVTAFLEDEKKMRAAAEAAED